MRTFNPVFHSFLYCDASLKGISGILRQAQINDLKETQYVVGYFSRSLTDYQKRYSTTEIELIAIILSIEYFHFQLVGKHFTVITDHQALRAVERFGRPSTRLFNWALFLSSLQTVATQLLCQAEISLQLTSVQFE